MVGRGTARSLQSGTCSLCPPAAPVVSIKLPRLALPMLAITIFAVGVYVSSAIDLATGVKDDRRIVIDEVAAFLIGASLIRQAG